MKDNFLLEGGSGGAMQHPFNLPQVKTGKDLFDFFETVAKFVSKKSEKAKPSDSSSIKFDGINASIKLIDGPGGKEFAMDRGSLKSVDIEGITTDKLSLRFPEGHGMIKAGKIILSIFNQAIPKIKSELQELGLWEDPTKFINIDFVWAETNVVKYKEDFIAMHGINQFYEKTHYRSGDYRPGLTRPNDDEGKPIKDKSTEIEYDESNLENIKEKIKPIAQKFGFNLYTVVPTSRKIDIRSIDYSSALEQQVSIRFEEKIVSKSLEEWLFDKNMTNPRNKMITLRDGRKVGAMSKLVFQTLAGGAPLSELLTDPADGQAAINGTIFYLATQNLGIALLKSLTSPLGDLTGTDIDHEGIVLRNRKLFGPKPVKITGDFITRGEDSPFRKKEQGDPKDEEETEKALQENEEDMIGLDIDNPNITRKVAVFPGKFKPPQKGHLDTVGCMLNKDIDYLYILISPIPLKIGNNEIGVAESKKIWDLYLRHSGLDGKVTVIRSPLNSPVRATYAILDGEVPAFIPKAGDMIIPVASDKPTDSHDPASQPDYLRFKDFHNYQGKIPGVVPGNIDNWYMECVEDEEGTIHASDFRDALERGSEIDRYIPDGINPNDVLRMMGLDPSQNNLPGTLDRVGNDFNESLLLSMVEELLLEGDWQPIAKRRLYSAQKDYLDPGPQNPGKPFIDPRPVKKSNAFFAKEAKEHPGKTCKEVHPDTGHEEWANLEETSSMAGGNMEGSARKSPFINFKPEENEKTT